MQKIIKFLIISNIIVSCARVGTPSGGPKDITPPKFLGSKPDTLATKVDVNSKEILLNFDEYVVVKDATKQVIISPPPRILPTITPTVRAKKYVTVRFFEPLQKNTTYTINFGSGIQDNNEENKLKNFSYIFSTGDEIDSLQIKGTVKQSLKKEQVESTLVSLYKIEKDSLGKDTIYLKNKPYYVSRIDSTGNFRLEHLHEGQFRLIAFNDLNFNLMPDTEKEITGFSTEIVNPVHVKNYEIILAPVKQSYKVIGMDQEGQGIMKVKFKGKPDKISIIPVERNFPSYKLQHQPYSDSLYLYFNDKELKNSEKKQRIKFLIKYHEKSDTLSALYDNTLKTELTLLPVEKEITPTTFFTLRSNSYIEQIDESRIQVTKNNASIKFTTEIDSTSSKNIFIKFPVSFDSEYKIKINAGSFKDFLNQENKDSLLYIIKTKKQSEYGNLIIKLQNKPISKFFFQLLNEKYEILENIYGIKETFLFQNIKPGKYLIRILVDENNNGYWDPGDIENFIPAEKTFIYPKVIDIRAFWDINETWIL